MSAASRASSRADEGLMRAALHVLNEEYTRAMFPIARAIRDALPATSTSSISTWKDVDTVMGEFDEHLGDFWLDEDAMPAAVEETDDRVPREYRRRVNLNVSEQEVKNLVQCYESYSRMADRYPQAYDILSLLIRAHHKFLPMLHRAHAWKFIRRAFVQLCEQQFQGGNPWLSNVRLEEKPSWVPLLMFIYGLCKDWFSVLLYELRDTVPLEDAETPPTEANSRRNIALKCLERSIDEGCMDILLDSVASRKTHDAPYLYTIMVLKTLIGLYPKYARAAAFPPRVANRLHLLYLTEDLTKSSALFAEAVHRSRVACDKMDTVAHAKETTKSPTKMHLAKAIQWWSLVVRVYKEECASGTVTKVFLKHLHRFVVNGLRSPCRTVRLRCMEILVGLRGELLNSKEVLLMRVELLNTVIDELLANVSDDRQHLDFVTHAHRRICMLTNGVKFFENVVRFGNDSWRGAFGSTMKEREDDILQILCSWTRCAETLTTSDEFSGGALSRSRGGGGVVMLSSFARTHSSLVFVALQTFLGVYPSIAKKLDKECRIVRLCLSRILDWKLRFNWLPLMLLALIPDLHGAILKERRLLNTLTLMEPTTRRESTLRCGFWNVLYLGSEDRTRAVKSKFSKPNDRALIECLERYSRIPCHAIPLLHANKETGVALDPYALSKLVDLTYKFYPEFVRGVQTMPAFRRHAPREADFPERYEVFGALSARNINQGPHEVRNYVEQTHASVRAVRQHSKDTRNSANANVKASCVTAPEPMLPTKPLKDHSVSELKALARSHKIDLTGVVEKSELLRLVAESVSKTTAAACPAASQTKLATCKSRNGAMFGGLAGGFLSQKKPPPSATKKKKKKRQASASSSSPSPTPNACSSPTPGSSPTSFSNPASSSSAGARRATENDDNEEKRADESVRPTPRSNGAAVPRVSPTTNSRPTSYSSLAPSSSPRATSSPTSSPSPISSTSSSSGSVVKPPLSGLYRCERPECEERESRRAAFKRCGRCDARYCGRECAKADWKRHKRECPTGGRKLAGVEH